VLLSAGCASASQGSEAGTSGAELAAPTNSSNSSEAPEATAAAQSRYEGTAAAPEFPDDLDWINASRPLNWDDLRGKIVVLDFWTYGCINCIHMIPVLEQLQEKYADELVVIGVHSAKFENEGSTENIRQVARRYGRDEPIVNDQEFLVWRAWGARAWPTIAIVDPRGNVVAFDSGEIPFSVLDGFISNVEARFDELGLIDRSPFDLLQVRGTEPESLLLFPGKVLADPEGGRLFISDSNHNRIIVTALDTGNVLDVIGSGEADFVDGALEVAAFAKPQGLAVSGQTLYVADLDNHAIRQVDLKGRTVRTIAGTGDRGSGRPADGEVISDPTQVDLRSPWALELVDDTLFIAMAGTHQVWRYTIGAGTLEVAIGNGRESLLDGTLAGSELAQPSGLFHTDGKLYFADSESSSIRVADLTEDRVATVAGPLENTLFDFGDTDGVVGDSRLQHPLGVTGSPDGTIYITDTYNSRIKAIDPETLETQTIFGLGGQGGYRDGGAAVAEFDEPGGLDYADGKLYIADTNNHAVRVIHLESGIVDTLILGQIDSIAGRRGVGDETVTLFADNTGAGLSITLEEQQAGPGAGEILIGLSLPEGYKLNPLIQSTYELSVGPGVSVVSSLLTGPVNELSFSLPAEFASGSATVRIHFTIYYCETDLEQLCILDDSEVILPVIVQGSGDSGVEIRRQVELPELPTFGAL